MPWPEFCLSKAEECELIALENADAAERREWIIMAADWRAAASANDDDAADEELWK